MGLPSPGDPVKDTRGRDQGQEAWGREPGTARWRFSRGEGTLDRARAGDPAVHCHQGSALGGPTAAFPGLHSATSAAGARTGTSSGPFWLTVRTFGTPAHGVPLQPLAFLTRAPGSPVALAPEVGPGLCTPS